MKIVAWEYGSGAQPYQMVDELWQGSKGGVPCVLWREDHFGQADFQIRRGSAVQEVNLSFVQVNGNIATGKQPYRSDDVRCAEIIAGLMSKKFITRVFEVDPGNDLGRAMLSMLRSYG